LYFISSITAILGILFYISLFSKFEFRTLQIIFQFIRLISRTFMILQVKRYFSQIGISDLPLVILDVTIIGTIDYAFSYTPAMVWFILTAPTYMEATTMAIGSTLIYMGQGAVGKMLGDTINDNLVGVRAETIDKVWTLYLIQIGFIFLNLADSFLIPLREDLE
jgi:hypothetical protein